MVTPPSTWAVAIGPFAEEVLFRGVLLAGFARHLPFGWANAVQAALFASLHERVEAWPHLFALALVAGLFTQRSGSLRAAIVLHALNNLVASLALASSR